MYFLSLGEKGLSMLVLYLVVFELVSERVKCLRIVFQTDSIQSGIWLFIAYSDKR